MIRRILGGRSERRSISFQDIFGRGLDTMTQSTTSGEVVNYDSAMTLSAVYGATRLLSDTISTLPLDVYYRKNGVETFFRPLPGWIQNMNPNLSNHSIIGQVMMSLLLDGNAYLATLRNGQGQVLEVTVLDPTTLTPHLTDIDGKNILSFESSNTPGVTFTSRDIAHLRGLMKPGTIEGVSPIKAAREMIGLGIGAQKYGAAFFGNGGIPGALVEVPGQLSEEGVKQLKAAWNETHRGASNSHRLAVLTEGAKFSKVTLSPEDSQFLLTKGAAVADIARLYGVPPHLLADASGSTSWGSGLHEQNVAFSMYSLRPYVSRLEEGITSILRSQGIAVAYAKFDLASLSRGTTESLDRYSKGLQAGIYSIDEAREALAMPPLPGGEGQEHYVPLNLAPISQHIKED
tara:strand:+ start:33 stop:1241 length:1209 start_codon:yes stop_codon:yes gene_type:complete